MSYPFSRFYSEFSGSRSSDPERLFVRSLVSRLARYRDSLEGVHVTNHRKRKENKRKEIEEKNAKVLGRVPIALCSRFRVDRGRESVEEQTRERESIDPTL